MKTKELEELASIAGQLLDGASVQTARLAEIEQAKKSRLVKGEEVELISFEHAYRRLQDEQIMGSLRQVYQHTELSQLAQKELAANICRVLGRDPRNLEPQVQSLNAPSQQATTEISAEQNPIAGFADLPPHREEAKEQIRNRFVNRVKQAASTTWKTLTPFLNKKRVAKPANRQENEMH